MRTGIECFPCFLRQIVIALSQVNGTDRGIHKKIVDEALSLMGTADWAMPPAYTTTFLHRIVRERLGLDPFREVKRKYNEIAADVCRGLKAGVETSLDPLWTAARLAIAGNVIDFGIFTSIDIQGSVDRSLDGQIAVDQYEEFRAAVNEAGQILYLCDNAGEIVFDKLLIEQLFAAGKKVTAVVKGSPVLNDVTALDADQTDLSDVCRVIDNGSDAVGTILQWTSPEFQKEFRSADLVVSKGQANFETLAEKDKDIFFLFQAKCNVVSRELGLSPGSMLLKKS